MLDFFICGEGPTDVCGDDAPLRMAIRSLLAKWYAKQAKFHSVSRSELSSDSKNVKPKRGAYVRGRKTPYPETRSVTAFACCLAQKAQAYCSACGAIYFKDMDFPSSENRDKYYEALIAAMHVGFDNAGFQRGVPMVPKTRSESWMLCIVDKHAARMSYYENLPGSDNSPKSGKKVLAKMLGCSEKENYAKLSDRIENYDWDALSAPSFAFFKNRLHVIAASILHEPFPENLNLDNTKQPHGSLLS